MYTYFTITTVP